jgi:peroxiredoxin
MVEWGETVSGTMHTHGAAQLQPMVPKRRHRAKTLTALFLAIAVVATAGWGLGSLLAGFTSERKRTAYREGLQQYLDANIRGIELGKPLPDITVWTSGGRQSFLLHEVMPPEGLLMYVSADCPSCLEAIDALNDARNSADSRARPVVVVVEGDAAIVARFMAERQITIPLYWETQGALSREYRVVTFPTCFSIDAHGTVTDIRAGLSGTQEFLALLNR